MLKELLEEMELEKVLEAALEGASGKDLRKRLRNQTCERARKELLGKWSRVKVVGDSVCGLRVGVKLVGHSGCPS